MINFGAFYKITYGLFIVSSGDREYGNGYISNTVFQVTSEPPQFAISCNKNNYTAEFIKKSGLFAVSVLKQEAKPELISRFGYKTGKDSDKMMDSNVRYGETGVPIVTDDCIAFLECRVNQTIDVGSHLIFIGTLVASELIDESGEPLTYLYYRKVRKGFAPKNAPTYIDISKIEAEKKVEYFRQYKCSVCGFIYDEKTEGVRFSDLPEEWVCPVCGSSKSEFMEI